MGHHLLQRSLLHGKSRTRGATLANRLAAPKICVAVSVSTVKEITNKELRHQNSCDKSQHPQYCYFIDEWTLF